MHKIHWGILGCGKIAHEFAQDLLKTEGAILYAVGSRNQEKATHFKELYQAIKAYDTYEALASDPEIDIIYIATPHMFHKKHTLLCLQERKAVLCEKAFAMNSKEVEEMIAFAKAKNTFLMEALWTHFLPHYTFVLDLVASKKLGDIQHLKADFGFDSPFDASSRLYNKNLGGGSLLDVGIYPVFAALSLLGVPETISATATLGPTGVDHNCSMTLGYTDTVNAQLYSAVNQNTPTTCHITLEKGEIHINSRFHEPTSVTVITDGESQTHEFPVTVLGYHYEIMHCQEMLSQNRTESTIMTFEKSRQLIHILDQVREKIGLYY